MLNIFIKSIVLILSVFIVLPIVFFILIGTVGRYFSLSIDQNCWLAQTQIKWIKVLINKFII